MEELALNGDKAWLEEKFSGLDEKMEYKFADVKQDISKLYGMYEVEHEAHKICREEWIGQINYLKGTIEKNAQTQAKTEKKIDMRNYYTYIIISGVSAILTTLAVILTRTH